MSRQLQIRKSLALALGFAWAACNGQANAATILAPVSAVASSEFMSPGHDYSIYNTVDGSGLSAGYQNGVDNFAAYLGSNPMHTSIADGNEWFSRDFSNPKGKIKGLTITYGFGQLTSVDSFALWNEEFAGLGKTKLQFLSNSQKTSLGFGQQVNGFASGLHRQRSSVLRLQHSRCPVQCANRFSEAIF